MAGQVTYTGAGLQQYVFTSGSIVADTNIAAHLVAASSSLILSASNSQIVASGNFIIAPFYFQADAIRCNQFLLAISASVVLGPTFAASNGIPSGSLVIHGATATSSMGQNNLLTIFNQQGGQSWPQVATLTLGRWQTNGTAPETRLDFNLKDAGDGTDTAETTIMTLQSNGAVGIGETAPGASSILELSSSTQAFLPTRLPGSASIATPVNGMIIYNTTTNKLQVYQNGGWKNITAA